MHINKKLILMRTLETFGVGVGLSLLSVLFALYIFEGAYKPTIIISIVSNVIFIGVTYFLLRTFRLNVHGLNRYFKYNLIAILIYCGVAVIFAVIIHFISGDTKDVLKTVYTYIFFNFKSFRFYSYSQWEGFTIGLTTSALLYSGVLVLLCALAPMLIFKPKKVIESRRKSVQN